MAFVEIEADDLERFAQSVGATEKIADLSLAAAINRTQRWVATRLAREVAKAADVPVRAIRTRVYIRRASKGRLDGSIWIGLNPISASRARPRQNKQGVRARSHQFPGAFIVKNRRGMLSVMRRTGKERLPIEPMEIEVQKAAELIIRRSVWPGAQKYLINEFVRQMRWRMEKASAQGQ